MTPLWLAIFGMAGLLFGALICRDLEEYATRVGGSESTPAGEVPSTPQRVASKPERPLERAAKVRCVIVAICTAGLFVAAAIQYGAGWRAVLVGPFLGVMLSLGLFDARHRLLPNRVVHPSLAAFAIAVIALWKVVDLDLSVALVGALAYGGGLLVVALVSPRSMGMGDVKLAALIGLVLGALGSGWLFVGTLGGLLAAGLGGVAVLLKHRTRGRTIPLGPYIAGAAMVAALYGESIYAWYRSMG
jgi:leader peptidase (prepilin peptidase)/N-methyltransferase